MALKPLFANSIASWMKGVHSPGQVEGEKQLVRFLIFLKKLFYLIAARH